MDAATARGRSGSPPECLHWRSERHPDWMGDVHEHMCQRHDISAPTSLRNGG